MASGGSWPRTSRSRSTPRRIDAALPHARRSSSSAKDIRSELGDPVTLILGVDRLDYTKGIGVRFKVVEELLHDGSLDPASVVFVQVATPSRGTIEEYQHVREAIEHAVGRIMGTFASVGANPVQYLHQQMDVAELVALYKAADVMLVTPLRDGMNLVAKEYVAARTDGDGALVLSEFAGAAFELTQAWLVNPYDADGMKGALLAAVHAGRTDRRARMAAMREQVFTYDVERWATDFLASLDR